MSKTTAVNEFEKILGKLNPTQKEAVDTIEGPVMVIAGPGTGKTQILTLRIANILKQTDTKPEQILALTFTESGVKAMRARLTSFIGAAAYQVPIYTFHGFAGELIRKYPDAYRYIVGGRPATDLEKISTIEEILEDNTFKRLRPHGDHGYYVKPILDAIATLKKENIEPEDFSAYIKEQESKLSEIEKIYQKGAHKGKIRGEYLEAEKFLERNLELLQVYQRYVATLRSKKLFDYEDMIIETINVLENESDILLDVQEQYQYILADEHQDVNGSQNRLIELIASYHDNPNVFVVGDEKQAIYRFQGASLENFLYFGELYKSAKIISLTSNYRSNQQILDIAHEAIQTTDADINKLRLPLKAENKHSAVIAKRAFAHTAIEDAFVVEKVKQHHDSGVDWSEIAIIVRTNKEVENLAAALRQH
jgi:DNA helicase II / ATP-dependent DNA helicase PcrA